MPHKHVRKHGSDAQHFDLPPSALAKALPAYHKKPAQSKPKALRSKDQTGRKSNSSVKTSCGADDTPRAFARMMLDATKKRRAPGLDDGDRAKSRKKARSDTVLETGRRTIPIAAAEVPKLLPGERLSDFSARVDQTIPISGLAKKRIAKIDGVKERQTKTEKRLHKMYAEWRAEEAKIKAREEERVEQAEEEEEDKMAEFGGQDIRLPEGKRAKRKRAIGETGVMNDDPWAVLKKKREAPKGLHDVVQAPPDLIVPKEKFNVRNGAKVSVANVPTSSGSLKKREELSEARREVIERYRLMMKTGSR